MDGAGLGKPTWRRSLRLGCGFLIGIALCRPTLSAAQALQKITVGYSSPSGNQSVIFLGKDGGNYQKHGLDVELIFIGAGSKMTAAILAGDIKIALVGGVAPVSARLRGADLKIVAVAFNRLALSLIAQKDIRSVADLKGRRVAVTRFGSNTDLGIRYVLKTHGLLPDKDVAILQFGDVPSAFAALQAGAVQGCMLSYPTTSAAKKAGFKELIDISDSALEYASSNIVVTDRYLQSQRDVIRRFLMGFIEGMHRFKTDEAFAKRVMGKYLRINDATVLDETYKLFAPKIPRAPLATPGGIRTALESITDDPRTRTAKPEEFYDDSIVRGLDKEGFIQQLYR
ncbi:MAG: ABC transporter substrate-binding protein [Deltaproteobacteria bacterium]|nr:ABC transporter substrate-binding protein [Deltaproteobacteria bacterium]